MATSTDELLRSTLPDLRWAAVPKRVRAFSHGEAVVDATDVRLVSEPRRVVGFYAVRRDAIHPAPVDPVLVTPLADPPPFLTPHDAFARHTTPGTAWTIPTPGGPLVGAGFTPDDPDLADWVLLDWKAFDEWREEEQTVIGHPHDPYHRIDSLTGGRHVVVTVDGQVLADSTRPVVLVETGLPPRYYLPREDVRMDLLTPNDTHTVCAYKGVASYWSATVDGRTVADAAWTYPDPLHDGEPVRDLVCFYDDRVDVAVSLAG
ncbi:DUF427 domain-containing protein [Tersicoccus sp. MR15.9]|uniref:DUF427 domain-containing protein n=1 Tax=Tersicoccus mangrovi TaxID=3121635 RepID=UPI002FE6A5EE